MKYLKTILFIFSSIYAMSQNYSGVVNVDSTFTKNVLYSNGLSFFANTFKSSNHVIQMKEPESGKIIGKGIVNNRDVTITILCKDGKYKYDILIEEPKGYTLNLKTKYLGYEKTWSYMNVSTEGESKVDIIFDNNNNAIIRKEDVYFDLKEGGVYRYYYDSYHKGHNPCMGTNKIYKEWKVMIDKEFVENNNYSDVTQPEDKIINNLVSILKSEMSKVDW